MGRICDMRGRCGYGDIGCLPLCDSLACVWPPGCSAPLDPRPLFWLAFAVLVFVFLWRFHGRK